MAANAVVNKLCAIQEVRVEEQIPYKVSRLEDVAKIRKDIVMEDFQNNY